MKPLKRLEALERQIRGWLPKDSVPSSPPKMSRPWWWRPFWGFSIAAIIVVAIIQYFYQGYLAGTVLEGAALALVLFGTSYYIRIRPNQTVNRTIFIVLGVSPIGFAILIVFGLAFGRLMNTYLGIWPSLIITFTVPLTIGAFIGDWIGKRRNYRLPMTP